MFELPLSEPVPILAAVMAVILVAPLLAERWRVPGAVGLLLAGVVLGPNAADVLARDATIELLGTIGLLYIMFMAGLEMDLFELRAHRARSAGFGALTFVLPQAVGTAVGVLGFGLGWPAAACSGACSPATRSWPTPTRSGWGSRRPGPSRPPSARRS